MVFTAVTLVWFSKLAPRALNLKVRGSFGRQGGPRYDSGLCRDGPFRALSQCSRGHCHSRCWQRATHISCCPPEPALEAPARPVVDSRRRHFACNRSASEINLKCIENTILIFWEQNLFDPSGHNILRLRRSNLPSALTEGQIMLAPELPF
jgi:hypothetical protein